MSLVGTPLETPVLVVLRGNSASGKSSLAQKLREAYGRGLAIVSQDYIRRQLLRERDEPEAANIELILLNAQFALAAGYHTIVEGIMDAGRYGGMLDTLRRQHPGPQAWYYLDIAFEETLRRHSTKPQANEISEAQMRDWYRERDLLPGAIERVIGATSTLDQSTNLILADTRLLDRRPPHAKPCRPLEPGGPHRAGQQQGT
ncbi:AAA family ATPase [Streptacidiphilus fuscans]|uniref:Kinase n=1 Tax=Streptacidiphilus fuscans TaxID=2789292 RepID=A0A931B5Z4_9ACTN|nr:AAA family ATPase [Streptacidiphilus fuscans]MBF9071845.1 kinase [Streptacidiphilus fuscans]